MENRPVLTLVAIDAYDPQGPPTRKWCPLCGDGKPKDAAHRSLSIERTNGLWKCFRCGASGQARELWTEKPFPTRQAQRESLRAAFQVKMPSVKPLEAAQSAQLSSVESSSASNWRTRWEATRELPGTPGATYLAGRGISLEVAQLAAVRWSADWSGHRAVVFPIRARGAEIIAAQARAIRGPAKLTAGPKKDGVFFVPVTMAGGRLCGPLDAGVPAVILVEAPIDALSLAVCGFPSIALCGTSGPNWLHLACGLRRIALGFDADEAGERASADIQRLLQPFGARCERLRPESAKDWNEKLIAEGSEELKDWLATRLLC